MASECGKRTKKLLLGFGDQNIGIKEICYKNKTIFTLELEQE